jgi:hypothetical protein
VTSVVVTLDILLKLGLNDSYAASSLWQAITAGELTANEFPEAAFGLSSEARHLLISVLRLGIASSNSLNPTWAKVMVDCSTAANWERTKS